MTDIEKLLDYYEPNLKRPFGNSDIEMDVADILGWDLFTDHNGEKHLSEIQYKDAQKLTQEVLDLS